MILHQLVEFEATDRELVHPCTPPTVRESIGQSDTVHVIMDLTCAHLVKFP